LPYAWRVRVAAALFLLVAPLLAQDAHEPRHNSSYVRDDDETTRGLVNQANEAAGAGKVDAAIEALQALLLSRGGGVVAVRRRQLFVSPRRWASLALLSEQPPFGRRLLDAWREIHDQGANAALAAAMEADSPDAVEAQLRRYPAATAAAAALLALSDRALQRGDPEGARGYLMRAPEHVPSSELKAWLASEAYVARLRHIESRPRVKAKHWPTLGGGPKRARQGDPLPRLDRLRRLWVAPLLERVPPDDKHLYVHAGDKVVVIARDSGRVIFTAPDQELPDIDRVDAMIATNPGMRSLTVTDGVVYFNRLLFSRNLRCLRHNLLVAYDTKTRSVAWQAGATSGRPGILRRPIFFRGAPAVVGDRLYVYGAVREESEGKPSRKEEAYLFCFQRESGALIWHRFLGYGDTEAAPALPPQSGLAPAVGYGVVVVVTGLGVAAALDADNGEVLWLLRYNRKPGRERERLSEWTDEQAHPGGGWMREPPRIVGGSVLLAPVDSDGSYGCWLRGRRDPEHGFALQRWFRKRNKSPGENSLSEQLVGVARDKVYYLARREREGGVESYQTVSSHPLRDGEDGGPFAYGRIPALERDRVTGRRVPPEIFGRGTIAGGVLYVPTRRGLFAFDVSKEVPARIRDQEFFREIAYLPPPYYPRPEDVPKGSPRPAAFGTLVAVGGRLYAVSADRVVCYGAAR